MKKNSTRILFFGALLFLSSATFAATFQVTNTNDAGPGSLRQALADADANGPGTDDITFDLGGGGTIILNSSLTINSSVHILGFTEPSAADGTIAGRTITVAINSPGFDAFLVDAGDVIISGLAIYDAERAILVELTAGVGGPIKIQGCYIGTDETGSAATGNTQSGIEIAPDNSAFYSYVNPRVIIGVDGDGVNDANEGNLISNNGVDGVFVKNADNNVIAGNYIGVTINGTNWTFGNGDDGIILDGQYGGNGCAQNRIGTDGDGTSDNLEGNVIGANFHNGITIKKRGTLNVVSGNNIGLTIAGAAAPNKGTGSVYVGNGILIQDVGTSIIGVTPTGGSAIQRNYIGKNALNGITILSASGVDPSNDNLVMGNTIGSYTTGTIDRGNSGWGVQLVTIPNSGFVNNNIIGSNGDGVNDALEGNIIAFNQKDGVGLQENTGGFVRNNRISRNSFYSNTGPTNLEGFGMSINLLAPPLYSYDGVTPNDAGDADDGVNTLLNYPVITSFAVSATLVAAQGTCTDNSTIEFYIASGAGDAAVGNPNYREAVTYLFTATDNDASDLDPTPGVFSFRVLQSTLTQPVSAGQEVNSIAFSTLSGAGNTSEVSALALVALPVQFVTFDAQLKGSLVEVNWSTAQEQNASHFDVEKSTDGANFKNIGTVQAKGNSSTLTSYSFIDNTVAPGVSYYRLRQVDLDGKYVYTNTVVIRNEGKNKGLYVWPNPVVDNVNITLYQEKAEKLQIRLVDFNGRIVKSIQQTTVSGMNQISINLGNLTSGMYNMQILGTNTKLTEKIIKN